VPCYNLFFWILNARVIASHPNWTTVGLRDTTCGYGVRYYRSGTKPRVYHPPIPFSTLTTENAELVTPRVHKGSTLLTNSANRATCTAHQHRRKHKPRCRPHRCLAPRLATSCSRSFAHECLHWSSSSSRQMAKSHRLDLAVARPSRNPCLHNSVA